MEHEEQPVRPAHPPDERDDARVRERDDARVRERDDARTGRSGGRRAAAPAPGHRHQQGAQPPARENSRQAVRTEWVFDKKDLPFLGSRTFLTRDTEFGKKGALIDSTAVLKRSVADKGGVRPRGWGVSGGSGPDRPCRASRTRSRSAGHTLGPV
ncbi:hypothetical protein [Streptomyces sp. cmx-18-6]|uniref:hypothetical protein n=1 Tax=Streptomyces sp. cmx-18-6 TaxID=2790930 RepID=UPI003980E31C